MKNLVLLINENSKIDILSEMVEQFAIYFNSFVTIYHVVKAPHDWELLSRSTRQNEPHTRQIINAARIKLNHTLSALRSKKIDSKKEFLFFDPKQINYSPSIDNTDSLVITDQGIFNDKNRSYSQYLHHFSPNKIVIKDCFYLNQLEDVVLSSDFKNLSKSSISFLNFLIENFKFNLHLVFINTNDKMENSELSIEKMKKVINNNFLCNTSISIFCSNKLWSGLEYFTNIKGGELIILEHESKLEITDTYSRKFPIVYLANDSK